MAFGVRQKQPKTVDDAVVATLELQAHLSLANAASRPCNAPIDAVNHSPPVQPDRATELLEQLVSRMEKLQTEISTRNTYSPTPYSIPAAIIARPAPLPVPLSATPTTTAARARTSRLLSLRTGGPLRARLCTSARSQQDQGN